MAETTTVLDCQFGEEGSQFASALSSPVTVGTKMQLICDGQAPQFEVSKLKAEALNQPEHSIKLLEYQTKDQKTYLTVTSYRVADYQGVQLLLTDGTALARTSSLSWKVQSVIDPNNPEAGKPFGPFGPWTMTWPWWFFLILILIIVASVYSVYRVWKISKRKLEIRKKINEYRNKFNPFDQYQKELRRLDRNFQKNLLVSSSNDYILNELQTASLTYLMMEFELDLERRSPKWIVRRLRRLAGTRAKESVFNDLALFLNELEDKNKSSDIEKMIEWAGRMSEKVSRENFGIRA